MANPVTGSGGSTRTIVRPRASPAPSGCSRPAAAQDTRPPHCQQARRPRPESSASPHGSGRGRSGPGQAQGWVARRETGHTCLRAISSPKASTCRSACGALGLALGMQKVMSSSA